jgi:hypothetical protein
LGDLINFENELQNVFKTTKVSQESQEIDMGINNIDEENLLTEGAKVLTKNPALVKKFGLLAILTATPEGRRKLSLYKTMAIPHKDQVKLSEDIVSFFLDKNLSLGKAEMQFLAQQIPKIFPSEKAEVYVHEHTGGKGRGILADKYYNMLNHQKSTGLIAKRPLKSIENSKYFISINFLQFFNYDDFYFSNSPSAPRA